MKVCSLLSKGVYVYIGTPIVSLRHRTELIYLPALTLKIFNGHFCTISPTKLLQTLKQISQVFRITMNSFRADRPISPIRWFHDPTSLNYDIFWCCSFDVLRVVHGSIEFGKVSWRRKKPCHNNSHMPVSSRCELHVEKSISMCWRAKVISSSGAWNLFSLLILYLQNVEKIPKMKFVNWFIFALD